MRTVAQMSRLTGVSVRTLHHYDAIGLLKPTSVTEAGYRLYDDTAVERLHTILLFRELQFSLSEIRKIIDSPGFDSREALIRQTELLELKRKRLDEILLSARKLLEGDEIMDFKAFDNSELEQYAEEARRKWGETDAYKEYERRAAEQTPAPAGETDDGLMELFRRAGELKELQPESAQAQAAVAAIRQYITDHYYTCTVQIFACLGQMYTGDERMRSSIDAAGGDGTAEFVSKAIMHYCSNTDS